MQWFSADAQPAFSDFALPPTFFATEEELAAVAANEQEVPPQLHARLAVALRFAPLATDCALHCYSPQAGDQKQAAEEEDDDARGGTLRDFCFCN